MVIYALFFLSGAAALVYQVVWVRSLALIFGGSHLAVTVVLSTFMAGLALGGYALGKHADRIRQPLLLYGMLELGIALFAVVFILLMKLFPVIYIPLAQGRDGAPLYLALIRIVFSAIAMIIPTTLMGGTLPVLTRFVTGKREALGIRLSLLYGLNTLGAVAGALSAGFFLLRLTSVSTTISVAILTNTVIGAACILLSRRFDPALQTSKPSDREVTSVPDISANNRSTSVPPLAAKFVLWGIGISGFCALGYEVLWTRILTMTVGTSVYGFTIMLVAFLTGIALGSETYGLLLKLLPSFGNDIRKQAAGFGVVQFTIGLSALFVTIHIRDLPAHSLLLREWFSSAASVFNARQGANLTIAFAYMFFPAFFMGLAFPLAAGVTAESGRKVGHAVGSVLSYNTIGAIFGAAVSGFILIYLIGIERSLQILTVINLGLGCLILASLWRGAPAAAVAGCLTVVLAAFLGINQDALRIWDRKYFAIFRNNQPEAFNTPFKIRDAIANTDVLYFNEGIHSTISSIKAKGGAQAVLVNGKAVASNMLMDQQCQLTLGHLPMLLHRNPRSVLVVGLGTGMTIGATSIHPSVERLTLAEIEPHVLPAARTFETYNNNVLENPKLNIIHNDGRNFLMTTKDKYDVITADPIHPWTQGSGYLYTDEYFKIASEHLRLGGIMCQWLPIYELSRDDLKSVVRTFSRHFKHTMMWLTHYDAEIMGSNTPIVIDESELDKRIGYPPVAKDLGRVMMGSSTDFLSYFVMGTKGMKAFGKGGVINTDDNLYLEFSAPASVGVNVMGANVEAITRYRESILPYLVPETVGASRTEQVRRWQRNHAAAIVTDRAHALYLGKRENMPEFRFLTAELGKKYRTFAPGRFLRREYRVSMARIPVLLQDVSLVLLGDEGQRITVELSAVVARVNEKRAAVIFVDNAAKKIFGQLYFSGPDLDDRMDSFAGEVMAGIQEAYRSETEKALSRGNEFAAAGPTLLRIKKLIKRSVRRHKAKTLQARPDGEAAALTH